MEIKRLELLVRKIEPDGTETHLAVRAEYYSPRFRENNYVEQLKKCCPALYNLMFSGGENYERIESR